MRVIALDERRNLRLQHPHDHRGHEPIRDGEVLSRPGGARKQVTRRDFRKEARHGEEEGIDPADDFQRLRSRRGELALPEPEAHEHLHHHDDGVDEPAQRAGQAGPVVAAEGAVDFEAEEEADGED